MLNNGLHLSHNGLADEFLTKTISDKPTNSDDSSNAGDWVRNALVEPGANFTSAEIAIMDKLWQSEGK
jgi:hypothetical protein